MQPANLSRHRHPVPEGNGGYGHNGAARKAGPNQPIHDAGWAYSLPSSPTRQHARVGEGAWSIRQYTSQDCSGSGERVHKASSVRTCVCTHCGLILHRDENAARNIL